jgi:hypothetical protein
VKLTSLSPLALAAVLALTGCGGGSSTATAPATGASAAAPTTAAVAAITDGKVLAQRLNDGLTKAGSGKAVMTMSGMSSAAASGAMEGTTEFVVKGDHMDTKATMSIMGKTVEVRSIGGIMYMKGLMPAAAIGGKSWVKIDPNGTDAFSKQMAPTLKQSGDLRAQIDMYAGAQVAVVDTTNGVTHYKLTGLTGAPATTGTAGAAPQSVDIWMDSQDRPTKMTVTTPEGSVQVTYSDFGAPITVEAPPAAEVGTFSMPS